MRIGSDDVTWLTFDDRQKNWCGAEIWARVVLHRAKLRADAGLTVHARELCQLLLQSRDHLGLCSCVPDARTVARMATRVAPLCRDNLVQSLLILVTFFLTVSGDVRSFHQETSTIVSAPLGPAVPVAPTTPTLPLFPAYQTGQLPIYPGLFSARWSEWSTWSTCSSLCRPGESHARSRTCLDNNGNTLKNLSPCIAAQVLDWLNKQDTNGDSKPLRGAPWLKLFLPTSADMVHLSRQGNFTCLSKLVVVGLLPDFVLPAASLNIFKS